MDLNGKQVVVVGGAIGGAGAALLLARAGAKVTLLEKVREPRAVGAGIALAENGLAVLEGLGLPVAGIGRAVTGARVVDGCGRTLYRPDPQPRMLVVRRSELSALLHDALTREPGVTTRFGLEVDRVTPGGTVLADGEVIEGDLVIGADGVHSKVRETAGFQCEVRKTGIAYVRGMAGAGVARGEEAWTEAGLFGSFAVPGGTYFFASLGNAACRTALQARDLDGLRAAWAEAYPPSQAILADLLSFDGLLVNDVIRVTCRRFVSGRVALLGDAAHAMPPNLGQGANSALVDAAVLVDELARADAVERALAAYDARRRPAVTKVADTAARLGAVAEWTNPLLRLLRDRVIMPLAARTSSGAAAMRVVLQEDARTLATIAGGAR